MVYYHSIVTCPRQLTQGALATTMDFAPNAKAGFISALIQAKANNIYCRTAGLGTYTDTYTNGLYATQWARQAETQQKQVVTSYHG